MTKEALKLAAQAVLTQWNSPAWTWHKLGPTGDLMADLQEALAQPAQPDHNPQHTYTLQEMLAQLHLYEEINEHYAECNPGPEALRDWVAERMDKPSPLPEQPQRPWVGLTGQEKAWIASVSLDVHDAVHRTDAKLKEKNNGISSRSMANGSPFQ